MHPAVIAAAYKPINERDKNKNAAEEDGRTIAGAILVDRRQQPPVLAVGCATQAAIDQQAGHRVEQGNNHVREQAEQDAADTEPE